MIQEKINLRQSRDFGETFNASIKFLRQNFKILLLSLLCIAGPFLLLSSIAGAFYQMTAIQNAMNPVDFQSTNPFEIMTRQFSAWYFIFVLAASISQVVLTTTVYSVMINYQDKGPGNFTVNDVGRHIARNFLNILVAYLFIVLSMILVFGLITAILLVIGQALPVLAIILAILVVLGLLTIGPTIFWQFSAIYLSVMQPDSILVRGIAKPFRITRGNFWWTWVIVACATIAVGLMAIVFGLPQAGYQMVIVLSHRGEEVPVAFMVVSAICMFMSGLTYSVMYIVFGVHYYSLAEKKEGTGIMERINEIGSTGNNNENLQY